MSLSGISATLNFKTNRLPSHNFEGLPKPITEGSLSVSLSFEGFPTGSLSISSISEQEIGSYRTSYALGNKFVLFGNLFFEVASYAETEDLIQVLGTQIKTYNISVNLRSANEIKAGQRVDVKNHFKTQLGYSTSLTVGSSLNLTTVAEAVGLSYSGYTFSKTVPLNTTSFSTSFSSLVQERLRLNLQILDWNDKTVRTKQYRQGREFSIKTADINYAVETSSQHQSQYVDTVLTGTGGLPFLPPYILLEKFIEDSGSKRKRKKPTKLVTKEGDINPKSPPPDVRKLRTIDMNFDFSGPRKTLKVTTTQNGQPFKEEIFNYGLVYLAQDIRNREAEEDTNDVQKPVLKSDSPETFWKQIEYQKTEYVYKKADVRATVIARDKRTGRIFQGRILGSNTFESTYLTEIKTTGWKLARFQQEQFDEFGTNQDSLDSRWLNDEIKFLSDKVTAGTATDDEKLELSYLKASLDSITFKKIPFVSRTQYYLVPATSIYSNLEQTPFQTQLVKGTDIGLNTADEVLAAIPDPNYIFPMKVLEERTLNQSFAQIDHPQNIFIRYDREKVIKDTSLSEEQKREDLKELKILPSLTTGEDTYRATIRDILPSKNTTSKVGKNEKIETDIYLEYDSNASHNDHNFKYSLQEKVFRTVVGQLPDATVFNYEYEEADTIKNDPREFEYRIKSTDRKDLPVYSDSLQYETDSLTEALAAAQAELELDNFLSSNDYNINLCWFYPDMRPGDYLTIIDDSTKKKLRLKNISFQIDYQGYVNGELLKTCSGTNITCGEMPTRIITYKKINKNIKDNELDIQTTISGETIFGLSIYTKLQTRRNPSGDQVEEESGRRIL